jgi:hypothetical protein
MNYDELLYKQKYLKYKQKYMELKAQQGGSFIPGYYFIFYNSNELNTFQSNDSEKKEFVEKLKNKSFKLNDKTIPFGKFSKIFKSGIYFKNKSKEPKLLAFQIPGFSKLLSMLSSSPKYMDKIKESLKSDNTINMYSKEIDNLSFKEINEKLQLKKTSIQFELDYNLIRDNKNELININKLLETSKQILKELNIPGIDSIFVIEGTIKSGNKFVCNETFQEFTNKSIVDNVESLDLIPDDNNNNIQVGGYRCDDPFCLMIELIVFLIKIIFIVPLYIYKSTNKDTKKDTKKIKK